MKQLFGRIKKMSKIFGMAAVGLFAAGMYYAFGRGQTDQPAQFVKTTTKKGKNVPYGGILSSFLDNFGGGEDIYKNPDIPTGVGVPVPKIATGGGGGVSMPISNTGGGGNSSIGYKLMSDLRRDFGLTKAQAAGVVGNLAHESGGFKTLQEINPTVSGSRGGYGYAQWTGPRRRDFEAWVQAHGLNITSYKANYGFLKHELTNTYEKKAIPAVKRTTTVAQATQVFEDQFLRAGIVHLQSRINWANKYYAGSA